MWLYTNYSNSELLLINIVWLQQIHISVDPDSLELDKYLLELEKYPLKLDTYLLELDKYLLKLDKYILTSTNSDLGWSQFFGNIYWNWVLPIRILHVWFISREGNRFQTIQQNSSNNMSYFRITIGMNCAVVIDQKKMVLMVCHFLRHCWNS